MNILVTGASRGIGAAIATTLAGEGRSVAVNYLQNEPAAREVAAAVEARGARAVVVQGNVRAEEDCKRLAAVFPDGVDLLVHNAAVGALKPYATLRTSHWDLTMESIPLGRPQTPDDIGEAVAFLGSDLALNITGQALNVDGGHTMA